ncbi:MAG: DUF4345 family protein [Pseudomonadota bacterium]
MELFDWVAAVALLFCAGLGVGSLLVPNWAAGVVRLVADPAESKPGGFSEFRATYGGLLMLLHATALLILLQPELDRTYKVFTLLPIAAAWIGAGFGRSMSLVLDRQANRSAGLIPVWIPMEIALGLAIISPAVHMGAS